MEVIVNYKKWLYSYRDTYMFLLFIKRWFLPNYVHSFFQLWPKSSKNGVNYFKTIFSTKCLASFIIYKMYKNVVFFVHFQMLLNPCWEMASCLTNVTGLQSEQTNLETTKDFRDFRIGSFVLNISATLNGVKTILIFKLLQ